MMMGAWWIWLFALCFYIVFRLWYVNWRGPLSAAEINDLMAKLESLKMLDYSEPEVLRAFLEADDGKEFIMVNLVRVRTGEVTHPHSGMPSKSVDLLQQYGSRFVKILFKHGGHPVLAMRKVGGYIDSWNTPPDPGWHVAGSMRYRSRRDMMRLALDPALKDVHVLKTAATASTFSFPSQVILGLALSPRAWVGLALALAAAIIHLASLLLKLSS